MKKSVLVLVALASLCFADAKKGDIVTSTGTYGCATQQDAIGINDLVNEYSSATSAMDRAVNAQVISNLLDSKYRSCKKIISGLDLKVQKVENWGPPENQFKYELLMVALPNNDYIWTIMN